MKRFLCSLVITVLCFSPLYCFAEISFTEIRKELNTGDWKIRMAAVEKLENNKDEEAIEILMRVAGDWREYWPVQVKAIQYLGEARNPKSINLLLSVFNSYAQVFYCPAIKSYTALALGNFKGNTKIIESLINGLQSSELLIREASVKALGNIGDISAVPHLIPLLQDKSIAMRLSTLKALENIGDPSVIPHFRTVAEKDPDSIVKKAALMALDNFHKI
jgi:HEAT repeat protein